MAAPGVAGRTEGDRIIPAMPDIVLATLNAKYIHASLGLRCLRANMGELRDRTLIREFTLSQKPAEIVEQLLALDAAVLGLGVYIWNVDETTQVVRLLKALRPGLTIVLGGPEVSHECERQEICRLADHVITGWGDVSFPKLCRALLQGPRPLSKVIVGEQPPLDKLALPYDDYALMLRTLEQLAQQWQQNPNLDLRDTTPAQYSRRGQAGRLAELVRALALV